LTETSLFGSLLYEESDLFRRSFYVKDPTGSIPYKSLQKTLLYQ
jgi:hypothetical protein